MAKAVLGFLFWEVLYEKGDLLSSFEAINLVDNLNLGNRKEFIEMYVTKIICSKLYILSCNEIPFYINGRLSGQYALHNYLQKIFMFYAIFYLA